MLNTLAAAAALTFAFSGEAKDQESLVGVYLCTTIERAAIASDHREGSGDPQALTPRKEMTRFKIQIAANPKDGERYRAVEVAYDGNDRDRMEWQDSNSVLHSAYVGDGKIFEALDGPAFLTFSRTYRSTHDGDFAFYHAGFEFPGGEDTQIAVRWGRCKKVT